MLNEACVRRLLNVYVDCWPWNTNGLVCNLCVQRPKIRFSRRPTRHLPGCPNGQSATACLAPNLKPTSFFFYQFRHVLIPPPCCSVSCEALCSATYFLSGLQQAIFQARPDVFQVLGIPVRLVGLHLLHKTSLYVRFLQTPYLLPADKLFSLFLDLCSKMCHTNQQPVLWNASLSWDYFHIFQLCTITFSHQNKSTTVLHSPDSYVTRAM